MGRPSPWRPWEGLVYRQGTQAVSNGKRKENEDGLGGRGWGRELLVLGVYPGAHGWAFSKRRDAAGSHCGKAGRGRPRSAVLGPPFAERHCGESGQPSPADLRQHSCQDQALSWQLPASLGAQPGLWSRAIRPCTGLLQEAIFALGLPSGLAETCSELHCSLGPSHLPITCSSLILHRTCPSMSAAHLIPFDICFSKDPD